MGEEGEKVEEEVIGVRRGKGLPGDWWRGWSQRGGIRKGHPKEEEEKNDEEESRFDLLQVRV